MRAPGTDALSLDLETVAAQLADKSTRDPWLARRDFTWGASDVPALLLAYDPRLDERATARKYHLEDADIGRAGVPRIVARKAGLTGAKASSSAMRLGSEREEELVRLWARRQHPEADAYRPAPKCLLPYVDRECPCAAVTPDFFGIDEYGLDFVIEAKCTFDRLDSGLRWYHEAQVQAQIAACAVSYGVIVVGPGWARDSELRDAPVSHTVMPDAQAQTRIRRVLVHAWGEVLKIKERKAAA